MPGWAIAVADYAGDGRADVFVTNSRGQGHAAYREHRSEPDDRVTRRAADFVAASARARPAGATRGSTSTSTAISTSSDRERRHPGDEPEPTTRSRSRCWRTSPARGAGPVRRRRDARRRSARLDDERARPRGGRLRQRRRRRPRGQLDRRPARPAREHERGGALARGSLGGVRARRGDHRRAAERATRSSARCRRAAATSRPRTHGCTSGSVR